MFVDTFTSSHPLILCVRVSSPGSKIHFLLSDLFTFISKSCKVHLTKSIITSVELTALVKLPVAILYMYVACLSVMQPSPIQSESQRVNMIQMVQGKYDLCYIN